MSTGNARQTQSTIALSLGRKQGEFNKKFKQKTMKINWRSKASSHSKSSFYSYYNSRTSNPNLLSSFSTQTYHHKTNTLAIKLNRLKEKSARYTSHKDFLSQCINNKLVPKGLELKLEPTIGNCDQSFNDNWYSKPTDFSLDLMKDVVSFCDKTIKETNIKIDQTKGILKQ